MTFIEAIDQGYKVGDVKFTRGYVSRKMTVQDRLEREVYIAHGNREGQLYVLAPCYNSTRYCYRTYLVKEEEA